jgi:nucleotide-binding universal stress UspA family protein
MTMYRRIVHPTDFSAASADALPYAVDLARRHAAELILLHVNVVPENIEGTAPQDLLRRLRRTRQTRLQDLLAEVIEPCPTASSQFIDGVSAASTILDFALHHAVSLIVMGTAGLRMKQRAAARGHDMGSTAEKVVRLASCGVMTVRPGIGRVPGAIKRVVVPIDFSPHARLALRVACELAGAYGATVIALHVIEPLVRPVFYARGPIGLELEGRKLEDRALYEMKQLVDEVARGRVRVRTCVRRGRADAEIVDFATAEDAQLIVQGSRGLSGLNYVLLGSVAERVVRSAPCPVLTVKGRRDLLRRRRSSRTGRIGGEAVSL